MMIQNNYNGALQHALDSGFDGNSTADDVVKGIDLSGKTVIITGGYTGIGLYATKMLSQAGATVVVPARSIEKARINTAGLDRVELEEVDLMDTESINRFADKFLASGNALDLLINNAGIMFVPLRRDKLGNESQLSTNYLAMFRLTARLWGPLKQAGGARIINISSQGHQFGDFNFKDPNFEHREYETLSAYGQSKTAVNLFTAELDNRAKAFGVRAYSVHPGNVWGTELGRDASVEVLQGLGLLDENGTPIEAVIASFKTIPQGASSTIWAATSPLLDGVGGVYLEDVNIAAVDDTAGISTGVKAYSLNEKSAKELWGLTERLLDMEFDVN